VRVSNIALNSLRKRELFLASSKLVIDLHGFGDNGTTHRILCLLDMTTDGVGSDSLRQESLCLRLNGAELSSSDQTMQHDYIFLPFFS
jgi:hypothetical protein